MRVTEPRRMMDDDKFKELMDTIKTSQEDLKSDFSSQISKLQQDMTATQDSLSQEAKQKGQKKETKPSLTLIPA